MEKLSNKMKKCTSAVALLTAGLLLSSGCGTAEADMEQPMQVEGLEALHAVIVTPEPTAIPEQESQVEEQQIFVEAEAMGNEQETARRAVKAADIYNQPSTDASVLGNVSRRDVVLVIGLTEDEGWYKIDYNGRVAYIQADVLVAVADASAESLQPTVTPIASEEPTSTPIPTASPAPTSGAVVKPIPSSGTTSTPMPTPGKTPAPTSAPTPGKTPSPVPTSTPLPAPTASEVSPSLKPTTVPSVSGNQ